MTDVRSAHRVVGVDVARFVALAGMMAIHVLPALDPATGEVTLAQSVAGGRASALFAVLAGVSLALATGRTVPVRGRAFVAAAVAVVVRAALIAAVGLALGGLDSGIAVILTYYGVLFLLGVPFLVLRARSLFVLAGLWLVAGPVLAQVVRDDLPPRGFDSPSFAMLDEPGRLLAELTFTGYYPAVPWLTYLLLGLALGRCDLGRWRSVLALAVSGTALALAAVVLSDRLLARPGVRETLLGDVVSGPQLDHLLATGFFGTTPTGSWWWLAVRASHSATPFDLAHTIGCAMVVLACCLAVARVLPRASSLVLGAGAMTLTLYTVHVLLRVELWDGSTVETWLGHVTAAMVVGALFAVTGTRGPLEALVGWTSRLSRRVVPGV